ncbi:MAG: PHP domain-containing protein [Clostridia bacterium]|nr:PHP domain-containing protein [Clostridia bacterium]
MQKYLLPQKNCYKANLHCHSTVSDGEFTVEQLKDFYKSNGYSILAFTDHEVLVPHTELTDNGFLALTGYEIQIYGDMDLPKRLRRVTHLNLYPKDPNECKMPFFNLPDVLRLDKQPDISKAVYEGDGKDYKEYSAKGINSLIDKANSAGFIVSYNHPTWSKEDAGIYTNLHGLFAMEIYNTNAHLSGHDTYCPYVYEEMLRSGQRIGCIATDDTHKSEDLFGGFTYVLADKLDYVSVISALENGDFYASRGPRISSLWYENGLFHIETSDAKEIIVSNIGRRETEISVKRSEKADITAAEFPLSELDIYVRFTVVDAKGNTANTRAYWRDEFESSKAVADVPPRKVYEVI